MQACIHRAGQPLELKKSCAGLALNAQPETSGLLREQLIRMYPIESIHNGYFRCVQKPRRVMFWVHSRKEKNVIACELWLRLWLHPWLSANCGCVYGCTCGCDVAAPIAAPRGCGCTRGCGCVCGCTLWLYMWMHPWL